jgi:hypothetical protein
MSKLAVKKKKNQFYNFSTGLVQLVFGFTGKKKVIKNNYDQNKFWKKIGFYKVFTGLVSTGRRVHGKSNFREI